MRRSIRCGHFGCDEKSRHDESEESILRPARMIREVAETDAHMMMQRVWHGNRDAYAHNSVGQAERVDVPVAQKQHAGYGSPDESEGRENWIGQMGQREQD